MENLLAQLILAARNSDSEDTGWMQMLVFIVLAVFYVVGSILKARANKQQKLEQEEPGRRPPKSTRRTPKAFKQTPYRQAQRPVGRTPKGQPRPQQVQPPRRKIVRPQPAGRKPSIKTEQAIKLPTLEALETPKVSLPGPQVQADLEELPEFTVKTVEKDIRLSSVEALGDKRISIASETPQAKYLAEILLDYDDPEKLRRAILHYEILGKPLSLRGPSEHII